MKERLGRSPDIADAFCLAVFGRIAQRVHDSDPYAVREAGAMLDGLPGYERDLDANEVPADEI